MIWEPFVLALVLGLIVSSGLYFAYLWPQVEPLDDEDSVQRAAAGGAAEAIAPPPRPPIDDEPGATP